MARPRILCSRSKKNKHDPSETPSPGHQADVSQDDPGVHPRNRNFSYADVEVLAERLIEQSRISKSGFLKQRSRRPGNRTLSEGDYLEDGIQAPTSTPDMLFLSRYASTTSTKSGLQNSLHLTPRITTAETCSATADVEEESTAESPSASAEIEDDQLAMSQVNGLVSNITLEDTESQPRPPRIESFSLSSNLEQATRWGRNVLQDIKKPLRRYKIRQGKQPAPYIESMTPMAAGRTPSKKTLYMALSKPSSSQQFQSLNLEGGNGPPKYMSESALNKLDTQERKRQARIAKEEKHLKARELLKNEPLEKVAIDGNDSEEGIFDKIKKVAKRDKGFKPDKQKKVEWEENVKKTSNTIKPEAG